MRDASDNMTAEIPGVEPLPPKEVRVTIAERRLICCYQDPKTVRTCRNCRHLRGVVALHARCELHDFPVALGGLCADHEE